MSRRTSVLGGLYLERNSPDATLRRIARRYNYLLKTLATVQKLQMLSNND
ncbi:MAG: hypothetical protein V7L14_04360 [Nostoc sp.]|nr:hypothetical protein [Nostoc sp. NOS(2021)]MBN3899351.1 hypothetical protein [Nostoc sp. NOS(2021)]